ncbi:MAG: DNA primase [Chloroflexi bacterium]|nr:DNA primase [Chloroflexota bacterium]
MSVTDEIKERLDIVEVISAYVPLKKAGRSYKGLCPFHGEKTPSFIVFPDSQSWHCFGACGTGGDVFSFVMKRENLDFGEALERLAAKAGVQLQPRTEQRSADEQHLDRLRQIVGDAATYFNYLLNRADEAAIARDYLERRGLLPATWEAWQLGYSLDSWDALKDRLVSKGYTLEEIADAGLAIQREDGSGFYDRFRGRLMIPIRDVQGRTIGFGARVLREDPTRPQPKYINSPQTPLFDKSNVLYGLDMARKALRDANLAVIVEGYMDVLMSHQVGVCNVVAGMGTALTEAQMRLVKRYSSNLTLALDPDIAGDHAVLRGLEAARQTLEREWQPVIGATGLVRQESRLKAQLRIAALPRGLDPDELARQDVDAWRRVIVEARPVVDYYLALVGREEDLTSARGKANAVGRLAPLIYEIASPVERNHYVQMLARLVQTDERLVAEQVAALGRAPAVERRLQTNDQRPTTSDQRPTTDGEPGARDDQRPRSSSVVRPSSPVGLEEHLLSCLLLRPDLLARLDAEMIEQHATPLGEEDFADAENRAVLAALQTASLPAESWTADDALALVGTALEDRWRAALVQAQRNPALADEKLLKDLGDSLLRLRERNLRQQVNQLGFLIRESEEAGEREQLRAYQELMVSYATQKRYVHKLLNARTMAGALAQTTKDKSS